jgi:hypothetical protein
MLSSHPVLALTLAIGSVALSSGCEKKATSTPSGKSATVADDGSSSAANAASGTKVPSDWPQDVDIYPGSKVLMTRASPTQQVLFLDTADTPQAVVEFYKSKVAPLKPRVTTNEKQQTLFVYQTGSGQRVMLSIGKQAEGGTKTRIGLIVNRAPAPTAASTP